MSKHILYGYGCFGGFFLFFIPKQILQPINFMRKKLQGSEKCCLKLTEKKNEIHHRQMVGVKI